MPDTYSYSDTFQLQLLACMAKEPTFIMTHKSCLSPYYFEKDYFITVAKILTEYYEKYKKIPTLDTAREYLNTQFPATHFPEAVLNKTLETLDIVYKTNTDELKYISDEVLKFGQRQAIKMAMSKSVDLLRSSNDRFNPENLEKIKAEFEKALRVGRTFSEMVEFSSIADALHLHIKDFFPDATRRTVPTPFPSLNDAMTFKGMRAGELIEIMGHPGFGKSTFATNFGVAAAMAGFEVDLISTELNVSSYLLKIAARLTGMSPSEVQGKYPAYQELIQRYLQENKMKFRIMKVPMYQATVDEIRSYLAAQRSLSNANTGLLIVDSPDHILPRTMATEKSRMDFGLVYGDLKTLGEDYNCPIVLTTQANRSSMDKETFGIEADSESWYKPAICDVVLTINRSIEEDKQQRARLFVGKLREGKDKFTIRLMLRTDIATAKEATD